MWHQEAFQEQKREYLKAKIGELETNSNINIPLTL
jgi:hypothetical protein